MVYLSKTNSAIAFLDSDYFPQSNDVVDGSVAKSRRQQIKTGLISSTWSIDDHLLALSARVNPLHVLGEDLLSAAIHAQAALWPGSEPNKSI